MSYSTIEDSIAELTEVKDEFGQHLGNQSDIAGTSTTVGKILDDEGADGSGVQAIGSTIHSNSVNGLPKRSDPAHDLLTEVDSGVINPNAPAVDLAIVSVFFHSNMKNV